MSSIDQLSAGRELRLLGKYVEARHRLEQLLQTADGVLRLQAVAELATMMRIQGRIKEALELLDIEILRFSATATEQDVLLRLEMDACLLRPVVLGSFKGVLEKASSVFEKASILHADDSLDTTWVSPSRRRCLCSWVI